MNAVRSPAASPRWLRTATGIVTWPFDVTVADAILPPHAIIPYFNVRRQERQVRFRLFFINRAPAQLTAFAPLEVLRCQTPTNILRRSLSRQKGYCRITNIRRTMPTR